MSSFVAIEQTLNYAIPKEAAEMMNGGTELEIHIASCARMHRFYFIKQLDAEGK